MKRLRIHALVLILWFIGVFGWAQPTISPDASSLELDDLGVYAVGYAYRGQPEQQFPLGWSGFFEEQTGVACEPFGSQNGRAAFLLHCPWRNGTGIAFQQFAFSLPLQASRILLRGATAMRSESVTNSDGVTFRLFANGAKLFEYHQTNNVWRTFEYDFTAFRGTNLIIRFEVDPGPNNNASFDYSFWGGRQLVLEGFTPAVVLRPVPPALVLSNLWSGKTADVAPSSGFAGTSTSWLSNGAAYFRYSGPDGSLQYQWRPPQSANEGLFGAITLRGQMVGDSSVNVPLANSASLSWTQPASFAGSRWEQTNSGCTLLRFFNSGATSITVRITGRLEGKTLAMDLECDRSLVTAFNAGSWGPVVRRRQIVVPYYTGPVHYLGQEGLFVSALLDWTSSAASSHEGILASYRALTDGTRVPLRERVLFTAAWHLAEVLPNPPNPPSPWREFLSDKIVLDIWGGKFTNIAANLQRLSDYGVTNCVALIHDWQRSGYDNALPMHFPANPGYGGDSGLSNLVSTGSHLGIQCALHENYVDYYPNYDFYDTNDIALDSAGRLQLAWYNPGTGIQSFAVKPTAIRRLAASQSPEIHRRYATRANYLDVHSAVPPWFHVDYRASEAGAGQFGTVWNVHRQLWAYERATHTGPVFGEGNNHWYWSGCLDGVEAQFGSGWPGNGGFTAPLAVDFDLLKVHPLQFNHGMGYYSRWWPTDRFETNWAGGPAPMVVLDRYRVQEVAYGHAGFLDGSVYANLPLAWLEHHLLSPVMARYATARPVEISYEIKGAWLDASAVARLDPTNRAERVRIRYENGLQITANGSSNSWVVGNTTLPAWGWIAEGPGFAGGTTLRDGLVSDFVDAGDAVFLNARAARDWNLSAYRRVRPRVASFQQIGTRSFRVNYSWEVQDMLSKDYTAFVHFCSNGVIRAQQDHAVNPPPSQWLVGQTINDGPWNVSLPSSLPDGKYDWLIGLFDPADGRRVPLQGVDDGTMRIRLGVLQLTAGGTQVGFTPETNAPVSDPSQWHTQHLNAANSIMDFGLGRTDGSVWLRRAGNVWRLKTMPRDRAFTLEFSTNRFELPSRVSCEGGTSAEIVPPLVGTHWRLPLNGAREYLWSNSPPRLAISRTNSGVLVSWPASAAGFILERASNPSTQSGWTTVTNQTVNTAGRLGVVLSSAEQREFHRLRSP